MISENYLESAIDRFRYYKKLGERAMDQLDEADLRRQPDAESNNIATIVKHLSGNMLSRWTDFLTSDGEKPWREREQEFEDTLESAAAVRKTWEKGWSCLFEAIERLSPEDLSRTIYIRNEAHTVVEAMNRQMTHYAYHIGQIVFLAKQWRGREFQSLSIPKGGTEEYNRKKFG